MRSADQTAGARGITLGYRPGLDGLRAVAVLAVLVYHLELGWLPGGFLGVEVFFVLSGYLITLLLLTEYRISGRVDLGRFWLRRGRRLLPALFVMLAVTAVVTTVAFHDELADLRGQLAAAFGYYTNWFLILGEQSYFASIGRPPVLRHLWSLAIEEQFYLVWPLLVWGLARVCRGRPAALAAVLVGCAAASTLWMAIRYVPAQDPSAIYYGTDTRASSLLLGAALAVASGGLLRDGRGRTKSLDVLGLAAFVGLVLALATISEFDGFLYRGGFLLVSLLAVAIIATCAYPGTLLARGLGVAALTWIGKRSYGLYLWHWPIYAYARPELDVAWSEPSTTVLRLALTFAAAELSYRLVELPVRHGTLQRWLHTIRHPKNARSPSRLVAVAAVLASLLVLIPITASVATASRTSDAIEQSVLSGGASVSDGSAARGPAQIMPPPASDLQPATVTVLADSVLLGIKNTLVAELANDGWTVDYQAKPALMVKQSREQLVATGRPVGSLVIVGLGYNSLWERNRANYDSWAAIFDREADQLLATLTGLGAKRVVWVSLREPSPDVVPPRGESQLRLFAWLYPFANERIRALHERHPEIQLADWAAVSNRPGLTYDAVHLTSDGARLMIDTIRTAARI